jgi:hypothetical protein
VLFVRVGGGGGGGEGDHEGEGGGGGGGCLWGESPTLAGFFPAGEGAGYAGGIVSAAVDGVRAAEGVVAALTGVVVEAW